MAARLASAVIAVLLLVAPQAGQAQQQVGAWRLDCGEALDGSATCTAIQSLGQPGANLALRANAIGFTVELLLGPQVGSPNLVTVYEGARPVAEFPASRIHFLGRENDVRRFRLTDMVGSGRVLSAMTDAAVLAFAVEYADGTSQSYPVRTADTIELYTAIREVVPF